MSEKVTPIDLMKVIKTIRNTELWKREKHSSSPRGFGNLDLIKNK